MSNGDSPLGFWEGIIATVSAMTGGVSGMLLGRRRSSNGRTNDADRIILAIQEEGNKTRDVLHGGFEKMNGLMTDVKSDTRLLLALSEQKKE